MKDGISARLKEAREHLGMKQSELAERTGVSRSTQIAYEKGSTAPTTDYLHAIEQVGIDIQHLLFDLKPEDRNSLQPDWKLIQECVEDVDFFCLRFAPAKRAPFKSGCEIGFRVQVFIFLKILINSKNNISWH